MKRITLIFALILVSLSVFAQKSKEDKEKEKLEAYKNLVFNVIEFKMGLEKKSQDIVNNILIEHPDSIEINTDSLRLVVIEKEKEVFLETTYKITKEKLGVKKLSKIQEETTKQLLEKVLSSESGMKSALVGIETDYLKRFDEECKSSYLKWQNCHDDKRDELKMVYLETICGKLKGFSGSFEICKTLENIKRIQQEEKNIKKNG